MRRGPLRPSRWDQLMFSLGCFFLNRSTWATREGLVAHIREYRKPVPITEDENP